MEENRVEEMVEEKVDNYYDDSYDYETETELAETDDSNELETTQEGGSLLGAVVLVGAVAAATFGVVKGVKHLWKKHKAKDEPVDVDYDDLFDDEDEEDDVSFEEFVDDMLNEDDESEAKSGDDGEPEKEIYDED